MLNYQFSQSLNYYDMLNLIILLHTSNIAFIGFYSLSHLSLSFSLLRVDILYYFNWWHAKVKDEMLGVSLNVVLK